MQVFRNFFGRCEFPLAPVATISLHLAYSMNRSEIEKISKALADQTRLRIFEAISATRHMTCGEIVSMRGVTPATVSHHLKILSEAGLIDCRRKGQFVYSQAVPGTITAYARALAKIARGKKAARRR
jgi:ArsR family transcriptional regulator, arsenate/arsenite/antimonite-responsive transcriptional repressor